MVTIINNVVPFQKPQKKFAWSWSRYKNFLICPKRSYETDIAKNFSDDGSEAVMWGKELHTAMQKRIDFGIPLPPTMQRYEAWPANIVKLKEAGLEVKCELKLAIDDQMTATSFFDASTWFRAVVDVLILIPPHTAIAVDWKTGGEVKPEYEQLGLSAQTIIAHHPWVKEVGSIYVWLGHDTQTVRVYRRPEIGEVWRQVWPNVMRMAEAHRTLTYPATPGGLCKRFCQVTSCVYHGKGSY